MPLRIGRSIRRMLRYRQVFQCLPATTHTDQVRATVDQTSTIIRHGSLCAMIRDYQIADGDLANTQSHGSAQIHFEHQSVRCELLFRIFLQHLIHGIGVRYHGLAMPAVTKGILCTDRTVRHEARCCQPGIMGAERGKARQHGTADPLRKTR